MVSFGETDGIVDDPTAATPAVPVDATAALPVDPTTAFPAATSAEADAAVDKTPGRAYAGHVLRGRYRLEEVLVRRAETQTWRAHDVLLERPVRVHLLNPARSNDRLLAAARRAADATDFRVLRVLDATIPAEPGPADDSWIGPFIVCEYAPGQLVEDLLAAGPLSALEAAWLVREVADALIEMHAAGLYHQRLSPATVVVTATGGVKIVGFAVEAELDPDHPLSDPQEADVEGLGSLLHALLTGHWPGGAAYGLSAAPTDVEGRFLSLREVQPSVPPSLDQICDRILNPTPWGGASRLRTAAEVAAALSRVLGGADASDDLAQRVHASGPLEGDPTAMNDAPLAYAGTAPGSTDQQGAPVQQDAFAAAQAYLPSTAGTLTDRTARDETKASKWFRVVVPLVLIAVLGALTAVGARMLHLIGDPAGTAAPAVAASTQWPVVAAKDFDPEGNGEEHPKEVALAFDGDPSTSWTTMNYKEAEIGNKTGVGLVFDLGEVRRVSRVELELDGNGTSLDIRIPAGNATSMPLSSAGQWRTVGTATHANATSSISLDQPVETRYVLVYLTELPAAGSEFTGGIAEARFWG